METKRSVVEAAKSVTAFVTSDFDTRTWMLVIGILAAGMIIGGFVMGPIIVLQIVLIEFGILIGAALMFKAGRAWNRFRERRRVRMLEEIVMKLEALGSADQDEIVRPASFDEPAGDVGFHRILEKREPEKGRFNALRRVARR
jgi:hypothetical protein